jgi:hypothetical protein
MPLELVFLHVRPSDFPEVTALLIRLVAKRAAWLATLQVLLHRYAGVPWKEEDRQAFAAFIESLVTGCADDRVQRSMKVVLVGDSGLLRTFAEPEKDPSMVTGQSFLSHPKTAARCLICLRWLASGIAKLVAGVLNPTVAFDRALALPYVSLVVSDVAATKVKSKSKSKVGSFFYP